LKGDDETKVTVPLKAGPDEGEVEMLRALHLAIREAWERGWPHHERSRRRGATS
jgi:hypothetical protein